MKLGYVLMALIILGLVVTSGCKVDTDAKEEQGQEDINEDDIEKEIEQTTSNLLTEDDVELGEMI